MKTVPTTDTISLLLLVLLLILILPQNYYNFTTTTPPLTTTLPQPVTPVRAIIMQDCVLLQHLCLHQVSPGMATGVGSRLSPRVSLWIPVALLAPPPQCVRLLPLSGSGEWSPCLALVPLYTLHYSSHSLPNLISDPTHAFHYPSRPLLFLPYPHHSVSLVSPSLTPSDPTFHHHTHSLVCSFYSPLSLRVPSLNSSPSFETPCPYIPDTSHFFPVCNLMSPCAQSNLFFP